MERMNQQYQGKTVVKKKLCSAGFSDMLVVFNVSYQSMSKKITHMSIRANIIFLESSLMNYL